MNKEGKGNTRMSSLAPSSCRCATANSLLICTSCYNLSYFLCSEMYHLSKDSKSAKVSKMLLTTLLALPTVLALSFQESTVSPDVLDNLKLFAEYSATAYCAESYVTTYHGSFACPGSICPQLQDGSVEIVKAFQNVGDDQTTGLVMLDHERQLIVIGFRGTVSNVDWQTNLDFLLWDASDICKGCQAHSGFLGSWKGVQKIVLDAWNSTKSQYGGYSTIVTGHSLGGALATLCAAKLSTIASKGSVSLFTYGSPRVGDQLLASFVESSLGANGSRVTHLNDPIPRLPGRLLGFRHPYPEYHITSPHIPGVLSANKTTLTMPANMVVNPSDVLVLSREESAKGNVGYSCSNIEMHDTYLVPIADCVTGDNSPLLGCKFFREFNTLVCHQ